MRMKTVHRTPSNELILRLGIKMRMAVADEIQGHPDRYKDFLNQRPNGTQETVSERVRNVRRLGCWGDNVELMAAASVLQGKIWIYERNDSTNPPTFETQYLKQYGTGKTVPIRVLYINRNHYQVLVRRSISKPNTNERRKIANTIISELLAAAAGPAAGLFAKPEYIPNGKRNRPNNGASGSGSRVQSAQQVQPQQGLMAKMLGFIGVGVEPTRQQAAEQVFIKRMQAGQNAGRAKKARQNAAKAQQIANAAKAQQNAAQPPPEQEMRRHSTRLDSTNPIIRLRTGAGGWDLTNVPNQPQRVPIQPPPRRSVPIQPPPRRSHSRTLPSRAHSALPSRANLISRLNPTTNKKN